MFVCWFVVVVVLACPGTDIKGGMVAPDPNLSTTIEEHTGNYFNTYSKELLVQVRTTLPTLQ